MVIFFTVFFTLYASVNYYLFIRGWQALAGLPHLKIIYLILFLIFSLSYIAAKFLVSYLPLGLYNLMLWVGSFWFALMLYFFISVVLIDFLRLLNWQLNIFPDFITKNYNRAKEITGLSVLLISVTIILLGFLNTRNFKVKTLNIELNKGLSKLNELNVVLAADIHLSPMDNEKLLTKIVSKINELKPDIIFLAGDIVDDKSKILYGNKIGPAFFKLKAKYGIYAATGNHEFISGIKEAEKFINDHNIHLLRDSSIKIEDGFFVAARDDRSASFSGKKRLPLNEILKETDGSYPVILLDHTPFGLDEAEKNNIDLQLSGHVHNGQLFPLNFITSMIYEKSWGYLKKGRTQYYVTSGAGTWGPPVRTGSYSEIVNLKIKFVDKD